MITLYIKIRLFVPLCIKKKKMPAKIIYKILLKIHNNSQLFHNKIIDIKSMKTTF